MVKKVYLDTCIYIYHLEKASESKNAVNEFFQNAEKRKMQIIASSLVLHEIMTGIYKQTPSIAEEVYALLISFPGIQWVDYSLETAEKSAKLRSKYHLTTPDSIHLATAIVEDCSDFITNDRELKKLEKMIEIKISLI